MKKRIVSRYTYPVRHALPDGSIMLLAPGINLVEDTVWAQAKRASFRLRAQIATGRIKDEGLHADWVVKHADSVTAAEVNALTLKGAGRVIARVKKRKDVLAGLLEKAERGGLKDVFRAALATGR